MRKIKTMMKKTVIVMSLVVRIKTPPHHINQLFCPSCSMCESECFRLSEKVMTWFKKTLKLESDLVREILAASKYLR